MNSLQIDSILSKNSHTKKLFRGVYGSDTIKQFHTYPYTLVVNTQKISQPGEHWVGIYVKNANDIEYFDSFGEPPNNEIQKFTKNFKNIKINSKKLQSDFDNSCGPFVIYFIVQRSRGKKFDTIVNRLFDPYNDSFVKMFIFKMIAGGNV